MDRPWCKDELGVSMIRKNIKMSPLHQPNFSNGIAPSRPQQQQPQVYNISKNDLRSIVHQLTDSPSRESFSQPHPPPLAQNLPKPQNTWLQKIRPTAQSQINRPHVPPTVMAQPTHGLVARPPMQGCMHPLPHGSQPMIGHGDQFGSNTAKSPVSVDMRFLHSSLGDSEPKGNQMQRSHEYHRCPRSPYPLLSPGVQYPPPLTPRGFTFSSMAQPGILGPCPIPQPPTSLGPVFPSSPFGGFPNLAIFSPRWRSY